MTSNGNSKLLYSVMASVLTAVVVIFVMLFTGITGSVREFQTENREQGERVTAVEVKIESIYERIDDIRTGQKEIRSDVKEILRAIK